MRQYITSVSDFVFLELNMTFRAVCFRLFSVGALAIAASGQTPINDNIVVTFPNDVRVGSQLLKAGEYTVRQLGTASNPRLLEFSTDKGTSIQASATAIAVLDNNNRNDSSVILENRGGQQHIHRIWIRGKSYGYEFPVDKDMGLRQEATSRGSRLTANYVPQEQTTVASNNTPTPVASPAPTPENVAVAPAQTPVEAPASQVPEPVETPASQAPEPVQVAQSPAPPAQQSPVDSTAPTSVNSASQAGTQSDNTPAMPNTALDWANVALIGAGLFSTGLLVRTYRKNL